MIYKDNKKISAIYFGTTPISKVYRGTEVVFENTTKTILTLNNYVPAADVTVPSGSSSYVKQVSGTKTYNWDKALEPGTYTLRFNYQKGMGAGMGESYDVATCDISSSYTHAFDWSEGSYIKTQVYVSTTGFKVEYNYQKNSLDNQNWSYAYYANQYLTTVEATKED